MIHHQRTRDIDATQDQIWGVIGRYMDIHEFAPLITSVDALTTGEDGLGSIRRNHFENGGSMIEEVIKWNPNTSYRIQSSEFGQMPMLAMEAELTLTPITPGRTTVTWSVDYRIKYGPLGWLLGQTMMKRMMGKVIDANLDGLAERVAHG